MIYGTPAHLLGRHLACGAHHGSWIRVDFSSGNISLRHVFAGRLDQFCQAKIENLYAIVFSDKEVVGFEIAVDDSLVMRSGETARYLSCAVDGFARGKRTIIVSTVNLTHTAFANLRADFVTAEFCAGGNAHIL